MGGNIYIYIYIAFVSDGMGEKINSLYKSTQWNLRTFKLNNPTF
jgi:hypothetical protein